MTFDGPIEDYLHEAAMMGHNRPPRTGLTYEQRCALAVEALYGDGPLPRKVLKAIHWLLCDAETGEFFQSKKEARQLLDMTYDKGIRAHRDALYGDGFEEIEGKRGSRGTRSVVSEEDITAAVEKYRRGSSPTPSQGSSPTPLPGSSPTPRVAQQPPRGSSPTSSRGSSPTPSSRARVSYTGNIKNIPLPRACESWRSFVLVDGNLAITDAGLKFWMDRGMDEARIDLALLEADGKLSDYDRKTPDGVEKKAGLFFSRNLQEKLDRDKRYEAACARKEGGKKVSRATQEAYDILKRKKERGEL